MSVARQRKRGAWPPAACMAACSAGVAANARRCKDTSRQAGTAEGLRGCGLCAWTLLRTGCFAAGPGRYWDWGCGDRRWLDNRDFCAGEKRPRALSAAGDPLQRLAAAIDFRGGPGRALSRSERSKGAPTLRRGAAVPGAGAANPLHTVGRPDRASAAGPAVVHAVCRAGAARSTEERMAGRRVVSDS